MSRELGDETPDIKILPNSISAPQGQGGVEGETTDINCYLNICSAGAGTLSLPILSPFCKKVNQKFLNVSLIFKCLFLLKFMTLSARWLEIITEDPPIQILFFTSIS